VVADDLVQYVLLRTDLDWPMGSLVAQGIHAALRATHPAEDAATIKYVSPSSTQQMTTVVLGAKGDGPLLKTVAKLESAGIKYALWTEQPEGIVTALASAPESRAILKPLFKGFRLLK